MLIYQRRFGIPRLPIDARACSKTPFFSTLLHRIRSLALHLGLSQWEHDWLATKYAKHNPPTLLLRLAFGQTEERKKGRGFIGSHPVIAPLAQGQR
jgi:hypothetical protein